MQETGEHPTQQVKLNIEGMTCTNCAMGISKFLEKKGTENISVDFSTHEARFTLRHPEELSEIKKGIENLGYKVMDDAVAAVPSRQFTLAHKFYVCLALTLPLMLHMIFPESIFSNAYFQLAFCLPVFFIGLHHFGRSAFGSLKAGIPNMDVLILLGSSAALFYSMYGMVNQLGHDYLFFETTASIITLVLLGNLLEQKSVQQTTSSIRELGKLRVQKAKVILSDGKGVEHIQEIDAELVKKGHVMLVNTGDRIPADGVITWGECSVDESMISGESAPQEKTVGDKAVGGTVIMKGSIKMQVEAAGSDSFLSNIIELVKGAQQNRPDIQRIADKVSAWFVPAVVVAAIVTFLISMVTFGLPMQKALMHSVAVLVIACPCAMGLATPTAIMVGIGMITKKGILIKGGKTLETLATIKQVVFDKTGTLTTGKFKIKKITSVQFDHDDVETILFSLEKHSSHPIAQSLTRELKGVKEITFAKIEELKGIGMRAFDKKGNVFELGSYELARSQTVDNKHDIYLLLNKQLIGYVDIEDELKPEAKGAIEFLKANGMVPVLLSGDSYEKCASVANKLGIEKFYFSKMPHEKLEIITKLSKLAPTAMVGDGINDAPALAKADIGISLSDATEVAIDSSQVILLNGNLGYLKNAFVLSKKTMTTIKQNLFWAFFYNILAIPVAAAGLLNPMIAALSMALSDVFVVGNSIRLKTTKL